MPWIQISRAEVQQLAHFFCCLLMYFYKGIHLSLNRCVKKTANTEAWCCHILHEESLTLYLLSVFKSPSDWFTQTVEIIIPFGRGISGESVVFNLFLQLDNVKSSLNSIRYKICSSVAEGVPTHRHIPPAAEQSPQHLDLSALKLTFPDWCAVSTAGDTYKTLE